MMLKGLLKNIDPSLEEAARDMGASRWKVFTSVTLPLMLPGLGNAFLVTFIESIADFANPMIIGGSYDTLATTIYLQITGAYDKHRLPPPMAVVLLCITLAHVRWSRSTISRPRPRPRSPARLPAARMLITDRNVRAVPLTVAVLRSAAAFVILMYIVRSVRRSLHDLGTTILPLTAKWFQHVFTSTTASRPFATRSCSRSLPRPMTALLSHDHLLSRGKEEIQVQGLHRGCLHARHGSPRHGSRRRLHPRLRRRRVPHRASCRGLYGTGRS